MAQNEATRQQLAELFGVAPRTINEWSLMIGPEAKNKRGLYNVDVFQKFAANRASCSKDLKTLQAEKIQAETEKLKIETETKSFSLSIKRGEFIPLDQALNDLNSALLVCRARFLAMPTKMATVLHQKEPKEIAAILEDEIYQNLAAIAETLAEYGQKKITPTEDTAG